MSKEGRRTLTVNDNHYHYMVGSNPELSSGLQIQVESASFPGHVLSIGCTWLHTDEIGRSEIREFVRVARGHGWDPAVPGNYLMPDAEVLEALRNVGR